MKSLITLSITISVLFFSSFSNLVAQSTEDFYFESFDGQYYLNKDEADISQMKVVETLVAVFPDINQNHGILRAIPLTNEGFSLHLDILSVKKEDGTAWNYTTYTENDNLVLKIGDGDKFVHGRQVYVISYNVRNAITFYEEHDELFWNINGTQWMQSIKKVSATVSIGDDVIDGYQYRELCFRGLYGSTSDDCTIDRQLKDGQTQVVVSSEMLEGRENLSLVMAFDKGVFVPDPWPAKLKQINLISLALIPLFILVYSINKWRKYGKDPEGRGIIPQYTPPQYLSAMASKALLEESFTSDSISAGIIELAVSGYIRINELKTGRIIKKNEYELELVKAGNDLEEEMRLLVEELFDGVDRVGSKINLSKSKNKLFEGAKNLNSLIMNRLTREKYFNEKPSKVIGRHLLIGILLVVAGVAFLVFKGTFWGPGSGIIIAGCIIMIYSKFMPVKTVLGTQTKEYLLGLKDYIDLAEKDRIDFHQSPEGVRNYSAPKNDQDKLNLFEKLLPFAMIFGLEKKWAEQFKDLYQEPPEWFNGRHFTPAVLANSIGKLETTSRSAFSPPSSSGSSGFGGGGFSGGGGGGGGGGGW